MFDLEDALSKLNGSHLTFEELSAEMAKIRVANIDQLPPELTVNELIRIGQEQEWIQEDASGKMVVETNQIAQA